MIRNGEGGVDYKKIVIAVLAVACTLIGVIYAKDTSDVSMLKTQVDSEST